MARHADVEKEHHVTVKAVTIPVEGGVVALTNQGLILGEGLLGTHSVRRFKLSSLARLDVVLSPGASPMRPYKLLRFAWMTDATTEIDDVGRVSAQRLQSVARAMRRATIARYIA